MYICIYVYVYMCLIYMYICIYVHMYICMYMHGVYVCPGGPHQRQTGPLFKALDFRFWGLGFCQGLAVESLRKLSLHKILIIYPKP